MPLLSFNNMVICNNDFEASSLSHTLTYFSELGIRRFVIAYGVDPAVSSTTDITNRFKRIKLLAADCRPRGTLVRVIPSVHLSPCILKNPILHKFSFDDRRLLIQAPLFVDDKWLPADINYLLYKQKLTPVFVSFERNLVTSDYAFGSSLYKTQKASYTLDINYLTSADGRPRVEQAIFRNIPIIPAISNPLDSYDNLIKRFEILYKRIGKGAYVRLIKNLNDNSKLFFI
jgi:hypothetical protein